MTYCIRSRHIRLASTIGLSWDVAGATTFWDWRRIRIADNCWLKVWFMGLLASSLHMSLTPLSREMTRIIRHATAVMNDPGKARNRTLAPTRCPWLAVEWGTDERDRESTSTSIEHGAGIDPAPRSLEMQVSCQKGPTAEVTVKEGLRAEVGIAT